MLEIQQALYHTHTHTQNKPLKDNINQYNRKNPYTSSSITVLIPKGEARIISESRNAEYNFTDFLENAIPIRKLSLELPSKLF